MFTWLGTGQLRIPVWRSIPYLRLHLRIYLLCISIPALCCSYSCRNKSSLPFLPRQPLLSRIFFTLVGNLRNLPGCFSLLGFGDCLKMWKDKFVKCINPQVCLQDGLNLCKTVRLNRNSFEGHFSYTRIIFQCGFCAPKIPVSSWLAPLIWEQGLKQGKTWVSKKWGNTIHTTSEKVTFFGGALLIFAVSEVSANGESPGHVACTEGILRV